MAGYTRQSSANIITGEIIRAAPLNLEFDTLQTAFNATTGHTHDGTTGSGPKILLTGANGVSGILPAANGGTGAASLSAAGLVTLTGTETLTNKTITTPTITLKDTLTTFEDNSDSTKKMQFELSGITTATTRTFTAPDVSGTLALIDGQQTITNKLFVDSAVSFIDNVDNTKAMKFQLSSLTTAFTSVLTVPDVSGTLYTTGNILGTVSQSGGIPTGAIIERGSNANGVYIKYADGTMICTWVDTTGIVCATASGSLFTAAANSTWTFPAAFSTTTGVVLSGTSTSTVRWIVFGTLTTSTVTYNNFSPSSSGSAVVARMMAIGTWY